MQPDIKCCLLDDPQITVFSHLPSAAMAYLSDGQQEWIRFKSRADFRPVNINAERIFQSAARISGSLELSLRPKTQVRISVMLQFSSFLPAEIDLHGTQNGICFLLSISLVPDLMAFGVPHIFSSIVELLCRLKQIPLTDNVVPFKNRTSFVPR